MEISPNVSPVNTMVHLMDSWGIEEAQWRGAGVQVKLENVHCIECLVWGCSVLLDWLLVGSLR